MKQYKYRFHSKKTVFVEIKRHMSYKWWLFFPEKWWFAVTVGFKLFYERNLLTNFLTTESGKVGRNSGTFEDYPCKITPWNSMEFHGVLWKIFHGTPWNSVWVWDMEFHGIPWSSMEIPWSSMENFPWNSVEFCLGLGHGIPWKSMEIFFSFMEFHRISWRFFFPWNSIEFFHVLA